MKTELYARTYALKILLDKLDDLESVLDSKATGLNYYKFALIFQKERPAITKVLVDVIFVGDAHLPAFISLFMRFRH